LFLRSSRFSPLLVVCSMIAQMRLAPAARSIAPPIAGAVSSSERAQLARSPFWAT